MPIFIERGHHWLKNYNHVWTLFSQPIGLRRMGKVAEVLLKAAAMEGAAVLIKRSRWEGRAYLRMYTDLAEKHWRFVTVDKSISAEAAIGVADAVFACTARRARKLAAECDKVILIDPYRKPLDDLKSIPVDSSPKDIGWIVKNEIGL